MPKHLTDCLHRVPFRRYRPLNLPLSWEVVQKGNFGPPVCRGGDTPDFAHAFSNYTDFRPCGQLSMSSVQRARRLGGEKKTEEDRRIPGQTKNSGSCHGSDVTWQETDFLPRHITTVARTGTRTEQTSSDEGL